jgi:hypothetical protein
LPGRRQSRMLLAERRSVTAASRHSASGEPDPGPWDRVRSLAALDFRLPSAARDPIGQRARSSLSMVRTTSLAGLLLAALLVSGCWGSGSASQPTRTHESRGLKLAELKRFHRYGITFEYPDSWFVTTRPISAAAEPDYRFTVSTVPVHRTPADRGPCTPGIAKQLPPDGILAYLREVLQARNRAISFPRVAPRPRSFPRPTASSAFSVCGFGRTGVWFPFKNRGRVFYLAVYIGPKATTATRHALYRMLDGMRFDSL